MNILVVGNGAREHSIIWKLNQSKEVKKIFCTVGNAGIDEIAEPISIKPDDVTMLTQFVRNNDIDLTIVGPEVPLAMGLVDEFQTNGLRIFGPSKNAAKLESSKAYAKAFMKRNSIPTSAFQTFSAEHEAMAYEYLLQIDYPVVIKADGLAAGKGVIICDTYGFARNTVKEIFEAGIFGNAGNHIVIEEFLTGQEASVFAVCDGTDYVVLPSAQDHKKILDGEKGKNTGGMGSFSPANKIVCPEVLEKIKSRIIEPVLLNMKNEGNEYRGCLYCGLMIEENGEPKVIEFNCRYGDPETQVVLPLLDSDFLELTNASIDGTMRNYKISTKDEYYCSVVLASKGYPDNYETGKVISGLNEVEKDCLVFHAGTKKNLNGEVITNGGRVLNVVGRSQNNLKEAIEMAYRNVVVINFENKYFRTDIGMKGLS